MTDVDLMVLLKQKTGFAKKGNGNWCYVRCPTCSPKDARKNKRGVNLLTLVTRCFICEKKITIQDILTGIQFERPENVIVEDRVEHPQSRNIPSDQLIPLDQLPMEHPAVQFLAKDHLTNLSRYWDENMIGFIPEESAHDLKFEKDDRVHTISTADSLVFPVVYRGESVGWQLRFIPGTPNGDRMRKIRYMHLFNKGDYLYNYDKAIEFEIVVVTEGVKKALKFPNAVATLGKGITEKQIQKLSNWKKIIFFYDGEDSTQEKAKELATQLTIGDRKCISIDPRNHGYPSPDEMTEDVACTIAYREWIDQTNLN